MNLLKNILLIIYFTADAIQIHDLCTQTWTVKIKDRHGNYKIIDAQVPGDQYIAAMKAKWINDPYVDNNDINYRWLGANNVTYQVDFDWIQSPNTKVILYQTGIDTTCTTSINGVDIIHSDNMWIEQAYDVTSLLTSTNSITFDFMPPQKRAVQQSNEFRRRYGYAVPPDGPPFVQHGLNHVNFLRKMQSSFSWDWGPAFPTMGIQGGVKLISIKDGECYLHCLSANPTLEGSQWIIFITIDVQCHSGKMTLTVSIDELGISNTVKFNASNQPNQINTYLQVSDSKIERWWPNGYGKQRLYIISAQVTGALRFAVSKMSVCVGFRTVELVQDLLPGFTEAQAGRTFYISVNGVPMFLKGSNWIPADSFLARISEEDLEFHFDSMVVSNMNAIRVWGGGRYETEAFYQLADRHGILIWQDMMFAVALYPADSQYLDNVRSEVRQQVLRLRSHPSIVLWAGNNENELGLEQGWFHTIGTMASKRQYEADYMKLYNDTIWSVVNNTDRTRPFVLSSPSSGVDTIRNGGFAPNPDSLIYGDVHYYNYADDAWNETMLPITRCTTEFGFQSFPSVETLQQALPNDNDWRYFGRALLHRQHHPLGNIQILLQVLAHFKLPLCTNDRTDLSSAEVVTVDNWYCTIIRNNSAKSFTERIAYLSQIHQARAYQTQVLHYRSYRNRTTSTGLGWTMCALYWQQNDIWQAPTWSSIDYGRRWKMAQYMARDFYAPVALQAIINTNGLLEVTIINDLRRPIVGAKVTIDQLAWTNGFDAVYSNTSGPLMTVPALSSRKVLEFQSMTFDNVATTINDFIFRVKLNQSIPGVLVRETVVVPSHLYKISTKNFGEVTIIGVEEMYPGILFKVTICANKIAPYVWLEVKDINGWFDMNAFTMTRPEQSVFFQVWHPKAAGKQTVTLTSFKKALSVITLANVYQSIGK